MIEGSEALPFQAISMPICPMSDLPKPNLTLVGIELCHLVGTKMVIKGIQDSTCLCQTDNEIRHDEESSICPYPFA